jgi:purine catabolism regulator
VAAPDGVVEMSVGNPGGQGPAVVPLPGVHAGHLLWEPPQGSDQDARAAVRVGLNELVHPLAVWRRERVAAHERAEQDLGRVLALVLDGIAATTALTDRLDGRHRLAATAWEGAAAARLRVEFADLPRAAVDGRLIVLAGDPTALRQMAAEHGLACGIGEVAEPADVPTSVREALAALELSVRRGRTVDARELATLDALLDQLPAERLRPFVGQLLTPLVTHDRATGSELAATLRAYLDGSGAVVPVARALFMHPNTLRHRLRRVAELTGRSPFDLRDRIAFSIALRVADRTSSPSDRRGSPVPTDGDRPPV